MTHRRAMIGALVATLALVAASCGSSGSPEPTAPPPESLEPVGPEDLPDPDVVMRVFAECLRGKGWDAVLEEDGGVSVAHSSEQAAAAAEAHRACEAELLESGVVPDPARPPSEELIRVVYEENVALYECLQQNGFPVAGGVPSFETYRELRLHAGVDERWNPMAAVHAAASDGDTAMLHRAAEECGEER